MKKTFYILWIWYVSMLIMEINGIKLNFIESKIALVLYYLNFSLLGFVPLSIIWVYRESFSKIDMVYLGGLMATIFLRFMFWVIEFFGFNDKKWLLCASFMTMVIFFVFEKSLKRKIKSIETNLL